MGRPRRGRVEIKRIDNAVSRGVTFSKRRGGLLKKARELAVLCDAQVGVLVFSSNGKLADYCSPNTSWSELIQRYESRNTTTDIERQQMFTEIQRLRQERDHLQASLRRQTGEDLSSLGTKEELDDLQQQLESTLGKIRERKDELLNQQVDESHQKVCQVKDQDRGQQHRAATAEASAVYGEGTGFFFFSEEDALTSLQLRGREVKGLGQLHDHALQLW